MDNIINLRFHHGGMWVMNPNLEYINDDVDVIENFDYDYLSYIDIRKRYTEHLGYATLKNIFILKPGNEVSNGLFLVHDDESIRKVLDYIRENSWVWEINFYADHDVGDSLIVPIVFAINGHVNEGVNENEIGSNFGLSNEERVLPDIEDILTGEVPTQFSLFNVCDTVIDKEIIADENTVGGGVGLSENLLGAISNGPTGYVSSQDDDETDHENENLSESEDCTDESTDCEASKPPLERVKYDHEDGKGHFLLGMTFANASEAREAIAKYGVTYGYKLKINPNEPYRIRVRCVNEDECPFLLFISRDGKNPGLVVKRINPDHRCFRHYSLPSASYKFLAKYFKEKIYRNPEIMIKDMKKEVEYDLKINVSYSKCKRAKKMIIQELDGSFRVEFGYLEAYAAALKRSNPETKAEIELCKQSLQKGKRVFKRMFMLFDACKRNWKNGCRPIIGLDGCFLKGVCKGQLLAAVGKDCDDQMVPIAWAVVDKENKNNWTWFLQWLVQELDLGDGLNFTLISDMQKGLIVAVNKVLPQSEHRWCARHIYANWSKKWSGGEYKKKFWICAWSTYEEEFDANLNKLGEVSKKAAEDLMRYPPHTWSRAYFSSRSQCHMVDNNISESFNAWILDARHKPIVSMLEDIRLQTMEKIKEMKKKCSKWINAWSPAAMEMYQDNKEAAAGCNIIFNGDVGYEIGEGEDKHTVFLDRQLCTCRAWELTGIPCPHAICALYHSKVNPLTRVSKWYHKSMYNATYQFPLLPVPGKRFMRIQEFQSIEAPPFIKMSGRPRKKRIRSSNECNPTSKVGKLSKKCVKQTCGLCHEVGHNRVTCPNQANQETQPQRIQENYSSQRPLRTNGLASSQRFLMPQAPIREGPASSTSLTPTVSVGSISQSTLNIDNHQPHPINETAASLGGMCIRAPRNQTTGYGCYVDINTGKSIYNPGMPSEQVVSEGVPSISFDPDVVTRFPIPCERDLRRKKKKAKTIATVTRTINFVGDGANIRYAKDLPFKPLGLQWQGGDAMTSRQLQEQRDHLRARHVNKRKNKDNSSGNSGSKDVGTTN